MPIAGYYLGCPGWGVKTWVGRLFPTATRSTEFLERYARVFNTVEGNTTFYALPTTDVVKRWNDSTPDTFRFCFKFPRIISHDRALVDCGDEVAVFLDRIAPLEAKLGTVFLQLPPQFGNAQRAGELREAEAAEIHAAVSRIPDTTPDGMPGIIIEGGKHSYRFDYTLPDAR